MVRKQCLLSFINIDGEKSEAVITIAIKEISLYVLNVREEYTTKGKLVAINVGEEEVENAINCSIKSHKAREKIS